MLDRQLSTMLAPDWSTLIDMETMGERLRQEREAAGLTQQQLGEAAGVSKQAISQIENGLTQNPEADTLEPICRRLNLNMRWLQRKQGSKHPLIADDSGWDEISGYSGAVIGMGDAGVPDDYAETHRLKFRRESLRRKGLDNKPLEVYYGRGDSMEPHIRDGAALLVDRSDTTPRDDAIFILESDEGAIAKRLIQLGGRWFVSSDNKTDPKWRKPIPIDGKLHFTVLGRVRWIANWED